MSGARTIGVLQLVDTLEVGGLERLARDLANLLPRDRVRPYLATTRRRGPLAAGLASDVTTLHLTRRWRFDPAALLGLGRFVRRHDIRIIHAHGHSILPAALAKANSGRIHIVWHVHSGAWAYRGTEARDPRRALRWAARRAGATLTVTEALASWCVEVLGIANDRVSYLPNFLAPETREDSAPENGLPGRSGARIVCVANLRPEKDHPNLLGAMTRVAARRDDAHLLLVGSGPDAARAAIASAIQQRGLGGRVSLLGHRDDVPAVLRAADVGVLASRSEGFPLTLLEYGRAGLPTVATSVGQCAEMLDHGRAGLLVAPGDTMALADALIQLLEDGSLGLGTRLRERVVTHYSAAPILARLADHYERLVREAAP